MGAVLYNIIPSLTRWALIKFTRFVYVPQQRNAKTTNISWAQSGTLNPLTKWHFWQNHLNINQLKQLIII